MQLAANLSWMYRHLDWSDRFAAAANDGFTAVEILQPYDQPANWYDKLLRQHGLKLVLLNTPIAQGAGKLGLAAIPGAEADFHAAFERARGVAQATGCGRIHVMAGHVAGLDAQACRATLLRNLEHALELMQHDPIVLTLEALNRADVPGYFYHLPSQAMEILRHFDSPHLRLQFDFYHCVKESLDLERELHAAAGIIGHVQIAGARGRHEPDLSRDGLLDAVASLPQLGYDSWIGCEYAPLAGAAEGLAWCEPLRRRGVLQ
jgi:hydroxypyruvate isomerase